MYEEAWQDRFGHPAQSNPDALFYLLDNPRYSKVALIKKSLLLDPWGQLWFRRVITFIVTGYINVGVNAT